MLSAVHPTLPMRNKSITQEFYVNQLGFKSLGDFPDYLMVKKDDVEIHFFSHPKLVPTENYGMCYIRVTNAGELYQHALSHKLDIPELGHLKIQPWRQKEFALRDPDMNLLTFGESIG